jgi:hypothetical protein
MLLIIQIAAAIVLAYYVIQWPRLREADKQAKRERGAVDREMVRDTARHARNAAAKAALEPELAKLDPHARTMFLVAWESGETVLTSESLAAFVQRRRHSGYAEFL